MNTSSEQPRQENHQAGDQQAQGDRDDKDENGKSLREWMTIIWRRTLTDPVAFFTFWLAVFSFGLFVVAGFQIWLLLRAETVAARSANAAKESAEIAKQALVVSQRAYVRVNGFPWLWRPDLDRPGKYFYDITPNVANVGNTQTVDMKINVNSELRDTPLPDDFTFPYKGAAGDSIIGAQQTIGASNAVILDEALAAVQKGKKFFYIWGTITYRDAFDGTPVHTTDFTTEISRVIGDPLDPRDPGNPKGTTVEISFRVYPKHNRAD